MTKAELLARVAELEAENERLRLITDRELSFKDIEVKIRDGVFNFHGVVDQEGGDPAMRFLGALMFHALLGETNEMPPNYRSCEYRLKPANQFEELRCVAEIVRPGGRSSHEIRERLEAELADLRGVSGAAPNSALAADLGYVDGEGEPMEGTVTIRSAGESPATADDLFRAAERCEGLARSLPYLEQVVAPRLYRSARLEPATTALIEAALQLPDESLTPDIRGPVARFKSAVRAYRAATTPVKEPTD